jgi:peptidoglycan hydrolase-like protein with peptidoglycan-binding domain
MSYGTSDISGIDELTLKIYRWDGSSWNQLSGCSVNTSNKTVSCTTVAFSVFGLFGQQAQASSGSGNSAIRTLPTVPSGGFRININGGAATTTNRNVILGFNAGADIKKMAISMTGDFTDASQEDYVAFKQWDLCSKLSGIVKNPTCPDGTYKIYAQFYTAYGRTTGNAFASSTITLKSESTTTENLQQYTNLPFSNLFTKYLQYRQTNADIKRLQIFLNSDPDTKIAVSGAGSPGKETNYFGILTYKAVIKFQEKYARDVLAPWGFVKGTGYVGKTTLAKINELMKSK